MFSSNEKPEIDRLGQAKNLTNITLKTLLCLESLVSQIELYASKNVRFEEIAITLEPIISYKKRVLEIAKQLDEMSKENIASKFINKLSNIKLGTTNKTELSTINSKLGNTRQFITEKLKKIHLALLEILIKNFHDQKVKFAKLDISEAVQRQRQLGNPVEQLVSHQKVPSARSLELRLQRLERQLEKANKQVAPAYLFDPQEYLNELVQFLSTISAITKDYLEVIDIVAKFDVKTIVDTLYETVPWHNPSGKEEKLATIRHEKAKCIFEMGQLSDKDTYLVEKVVNNQMEKIEQYDDFQLHETYSSSITYKHSEYRHPSTEEIIAKLFGNNSDKFLQLILALEDIIQKFNSLSQETQDSAVKEAIKLISTFPKNLRENIILVINRDYERTFKRMVSGYTELREMLLYGHPQPKEKIDDLATWVYQILYQYLNNPLACFAQKRKAKGLIDTIWQLYFKIKNSESFSDELEKLENAIAQHFQQSGIKPDEPLWKLIESIEVLLPHNNKAKKYLTHINDFAWPLPKDISYLILSWLDATSAVKLSLTCKSLQEIANQDTVWKPLCHAIWQHDTSHKSKHGTIYKSKDIFSFLTATRLLNEFLKIAKLFHENIVENESSPKSVFIHLHDFVFKWNGDTFESNIIPAKQFTNETLALEEELQKTKKFLNGKLVTSPEGYQVVLQSIDVKTVRTYHRQLEAELVKHNISALKIS